MRYKYSKLVEKKSTTFAVEIEKQGFRGGL